MAEAFHQSRRDRIAADQEHDGHGVGDTVGCLRCDCAVRHDHVHAGLDQFAGKARQPFLVRMPSKLDDELLLKLIQLLHELRRGELGSFRPAVGEPSDAVRLPRLPLSDERSDEDTGQ
jgi:hypothetical protein